MKKEYKEILESATGLILIFAVIIIGFIFFDLETIQTFIEKGGLIGPLVLILAKASTMIFAPISGSPLYPLAGALFGFWEGFILLVIGDFIGSVVSFYISRKFGRSVVERFARGTIPAVDRVLSFMETIKGFFIARVCFMALPEATSYAAGLTRITFKRFITIQTLVGVIPTAVLAGAGAWIAVSTSTISIVMVTVGGVLAAIVGGSLLVKVASLKKPVEQKMENKMEDITWPDKD